jgi:hypothetical protein
MTTNKMRHAELLFYDKQECDMCDKHSNVVIINTLGNDGLCVCLNCLKEIIRVGEENV